MSAFRKGILIFLALAALFSGAFAATFVAGKPSTVGAISLIPASQPDMRVVGTFFIPAGNNTFCVNSSDPTCVLSQVPLTTSPITIDCSITIEFSDPLFGGTHSCYDPFTINNAYDEIYQFHVVWNNGFLSLLCTRDCSTNEHAATITYSAVA